MLAAKLEAFEQLLGGRADALKVVRAHPRLLTCGASKLQRKAGQLQALLGLANPYDLAQILKHKPGLLAYSTGTLKDRLKRLSEGLGMELEAARQVCRASPSMLTVAYELVDAKVQLPMGLLTHTIQRLWLGMHCMKPLPVQHEPVLEGAVSFCSLPTRY